MPIGTLPLTIKWVPLPWGNVVWDPISVGKAFYNSSDIGFGNSSNGIRSEVINMPPSNWLVSLRMVPYQAGLHRWQDGCSAMAGTISALAKGSWHFCDQTWSPPHHHGHGIREPIARVLEWPWREAHWHPGDRSSSLLGCWPYWFTVEDTHGIDVRVNNSHS